MNKPTTIALPVETSGPARFTADEFERMIACGAFDDMKVELIGGELQRMAPARALHSETQGRVILALGPIVAPNPVMVDAGIRVDDGVVLAPDVALLCERVTTDRMLNPDDLLLAVEISVATLAKDLGPKRLGYAAAGVPHYWVVDPERRVVHTHAEPRAGDYAMIRSYAFGEAVPVPGTDGTISLD